MITIQNLELRIKNYAENGYTLVELLAVMVVLMSVGLIIASILVSSLRGSSKTDSVTIVQQNGEFAIAQMSKTLRNARQLVSPYPCVSPPSPTPLPTYSSVTIVSPEGEDISFVCNGPSPTPPNPANTISSNSATLLDTTAVTLSSCSFTCVQGSISDFPTIGISFSLTSYTPSGGQLVVEKSASASAVPFQTSITLRNLNR